VKEKSKAMKKVLAKLAASLRKRLRCANCHEVFVETHWSKDKVKKHKNLNRDLVCSECSEKGFSAGRYKQYQCQQCSEMYGSMKFKRWDVDNFNRGKTSRLKCMHYTSICLCSPRILNVRFFHD
jgi:hypothetical protein